MIDIVINALSSYWSAILSWYESTTMSWNLIKDIIYMSGLLYGLYKINRFIRSYSFDKKCKDIEDNLEMRNRIEKHIADFISGKPKHNKRTRLCLTHWKNYPSQFIHGTFNEYNIYYNLSIRGENFPRTGFADNVGLYFEEELDRGNYGFYNKANELYINKKYGYDICFFGKSNRNYRGYKKANKLLNLTRVFHLPYKNIVNFDFKEYLEYSPVVYVRHKPYSRKLFSKSVYIAKHDDFTIRCLDDGIISKYWSIKHLYRLTKLKFRKNSY
jgi:hypothetical protein